jgi:hypothetical protein
MRYADQIFPILLGISIFVVIGESRIFVNFMILFLLFYSNNLEKTSVNARVDFCIHLLEETVLKKKLTDAEPPERKVKNDISSIPWWEQVAGTFANSSAYDEAMKLGSEYRDSLRPNSSESYDG